MAYKGKEKIDELLGGPLINVMSSIMSDFVSENSQVRYEAGLQPKIIRTMNGECCKWCAEVAGMYEYPNVPRDVYRRHDNCDCRVTFISDKGVRLVHDGTEGKRKWVDSGKGYRLTPEATNTRRKIGARGKEIIDKPTYNKLTRDFTRDGGVIIRGDEAEKILDAQKADALYISGEKIVLFRNDPTISEVLEEMHHALQDKKGMYADEPLNIMRLKREIDAQEHLLNLTERYKIPVTEVEVTKSNLEHYKRLLREVSR